MAESLETSIEVVLGQEFLTWLWYHSEEYNGTFHSKKDNAAYVLYVHQRIVVRGGIGDTIETASVSGVNSPLREAKMGLSTGKVVVRALIQIEQDELVWQVTLKADDFSINSLKTPAVSKEDRDENNPDALFLEKIYFIEKGLDLIDDAYQHFLEVRLDENFWKSACADMNSWIMQKS